MKKRLRSFRSTHAVPFFSSGLRQKATDLPDRTIFNPSGSFITYIKTTLFLLGLISAFNTGAQCPVSTAELTPTATNDMVATCFGSQVTIPFAQLLSNDAGPSGKSISIISSTKPTSGTISQSGTAYIYTPAPGFSGTATFTYSIKQNDGFYFFNGHYYQIIENSATWDKAKKDAEKAVYNGRKGYLITISTPEENEFIRSNIRGDIWIGASDIDKEGTWKWETGPEGIATSGGSVITFSNWAAGQPDNGGVDPASNPTNASRSGEHYATSGNGLRADNPLNNSNPYIIEFGDMETGCLPVVNATATVTITVGSPITLNTTQTNTCPGGSSGSVVLTPAGGKAPYSYDYLKYSFNASLLDANLFDLTNGNFSVNGDLQGSAVANANTDFDNSIVTDKLYADNGYLRSEASFKMSADATVLFGLTTYVPRALGAMPISFGFSQGALTYTINGSTYSSGSYVADTWYDLKIEKNGQQVKFYVKKSSELNWSLTGSKTYNGKASSFRLAAQYFDDFSSTRVFNTKNWVISYNPPLTGLSAGFYTYTVTDSIGCSGNAFVTISDDVPFMASAVSHNTSATAVCDGSVTISSSSPLAYIANNTFNKDFASGIEPGVFDILNGDFSSAGYLQASAITLSTGWANSITTKAAFADKGFLRYQGSFMFDNNSRVSFGFSTAVRSISNLGDLPISFYYNNGKLNYFINNKGVEIGKYTPNTWFDFKIEKRGTDVLFFTKAENEDWILAGKEKYTGSEVSFKAAAQYYGVAGSNGGFNSRNWKVDVTGDISGLCTGDYSYQLTSVAGCTSDVSFSIYETLVVEGISFNAKCFGTATGKIILNAKGGKAPYTYSINNGVTYLATDVFENIEAGTYQLVVKDSRGNVSLPTVVVISQPPAVVANISANGPLSICQGASVNLTATNGSSYLWSNGATTSSILVSQSDNYTVKVTDSTGCSATSAITTVIVTPIPVPVVTSNGSLHVCAGSSLDLNASGGTSYLWNTGATSSKITVNTGGIYSVTATNGNGCSATSAPVTVKSSPTPIAGITAGGPLTFCSGSSVNLTATGGLSYLWNTGATGADLQATASGSYSVKVTDANGCSATSAPVTVTANPAPVAAITPSGSTLICQGSSVNLVASGGGTYTWSNGAKTSSITASSNGSYSVIVTGINGCSATSAPVTVSVNPIPVVSITATTSGYLCKGVVLTATSTSSVKSYAWSDGAVSQTLSLTSAKADGTYTVNITDYNGCKNTTPASYLFNKQNMLEAYSILGLTSVNLGTSTVVATGSVGVTGNSGSITLGKSSSVASTGAFVKAKTINVTTPVSAPTQVKAAATVILPAMQTNTTGSASSYSTATISSSTTSTSNYRNLTIKGAINVTLSGNIFGTITVEQGATVTFTNGSINIDQLIVGNSNSSKVTASSPLTTLRFPANGTVKISTSANIYGRSRINAEENKVTFFCGDASSDAESFNVNGLDIIVGGTIYMPVGTLAVTTTSTTTASYMKGLFIADKITSTGAKIIWQGSTCGTGAAARPANEAIVERSTTETLRVTVMPNPSSSDYVFVISSPSKAPVSIRIIDASGRLLENITSVSPSAPVRVGKNLASGNYYAMIVQEGHSVTTKLVKVK
ncbi:MAG: hypothetical protein JWQ40_3554 [Segetibacter sp.]|nr:hypothetical protein [Segetibacter sp.]